jgi:hypothetical protein
MADVDPMDRSKRELARSIGTVVNHCVAVRAQRWPSSVPPVSRSHAPCSHAHPALTPLGTHPLLRQLSDNILKEAGHGMVMNAARDFSKLDRTITDTMMMMKQTAEPLLALEEHYDTLAGIDMMVPMAIDTAAAATARWRGGAAQLPLPPERSRSQERAAAMGGGASPMSTGGDEDYGGDALRRTDTDSALARAEQLSRIATDAERAQQEKDAAQARLVQLESSLSVDDRDAIEQLINDISLGDAGDIGTLDTLAGGLDDSLDTAHAALESQQQGGGGGGGGGSGALDQEPEGRGNGQRYSKEYYAAREAEVLTPQKYSGAYAAALARNKLEAKERGELEVKDAENRQIERLQKDAAAKVAEAERKLSENGELEAIEALISGTAGAGAGADGGGGQ